MKNICKIATLLLVFTAIINPMKTNAEEYQKLVDVAEVGDFVNYDAGVWEYASSDPISENHSGGWEIGDSKNESINCRENDANIYNGWRVYSNDGKNVVLISAGTPICYNHSTTNADGSIIVLSGKGGTSDIPFNTTMAMGYAHALTEAEFGRIDIDDMKKIGSQYVLATLLGTGSQGAGLKGVAAVGDYAGKIVPVAQPGYVGTYGIRVVVTLTNGVYVSGKTTKVVGTDGKTTAEVYEITTKSSSSNNNGGTTGDKDDDSNEENVETADKIIYVVLGTAILAGILFFSYKKVKA